MEDHQTKSKFKESFPNNTTNNTISLSINIAFGVIIINQRRNPFQSVSSYAKFPQIIAK